MKTKLSTMLALLCSAILAIPATFEISWSERPLAEGVTGYWVYSGPTNAPVRLLSVSSMSVGSTNSLFNEPLPTQLVIAKLTLPDGAYRLTVTATNAIEQSPHSLPLYVVVTGSNVVAVTTRPGAPLNLQLR